MSTVRYMDVFGLHQVTAYTLPAWIYTPLRHSCHVLGSVELLRMSDAAKVHRMQHAHSTSGGVQVKTTREPLRVEACSLFERRRRLLDGSCTLRLLRAIH